MDYENFTGSRAPDEFDILRSYGTSLGLLLNRWGRYSLNLGHTERRSKDSSRNYDQFYVGFSYDVVTKWLTVSPHGAFVGLPGF